MKIIFQSFFLPLYLPTFLPSAKNVECWTPIGPFFVQKCRVSTVKNFLKISFKFFLCLPNPSPVFSLKRCIHISWLNMKKDCKLGKKWNKTMFTWHKWYPQMADEKQNRFLHFHDVDCNRLGYSHCNKSANMLEL